MIFRPANDAWPTAIASAAVGLAPVWWHLDFVDPRIGNITAVFGEVAVYPSDVCLAALSVLAMRQPAPLDGRVRWLAYGLTLLAAVALLSTVASLNPTLGAGMAGHLALLVLAWLGLRSGKLSRTGLVGALVASAVVQAVLAVGQFTFQQTLVQGVLHLPWLPSDASEGGAPVVLNAAGVRLLRGFGTFPHPNILGGYLALALVCLPLLAQRSPRRWPLWWLIGTVLAAGLLASFSRRVAGRGRRPEPVVVVGQTRGGPNTLVVACRHPAGSSDDRSFARCAHRRNALVATWSGLQSARARVRPESYGAQSQRAVRSVASPAAGSWRRQLRRGRAGGGLPARLG